MSMDTIDWGTAQRVGEFLAGSPPDGGVLADSVQPLAEDFAQRVSDYSGLTPTRELPVLETVDRPHWITANLQTMKPLMEPLAAQMGDGWASKNWNGNLAALPAAMRGASGLLLGAQVGALTGLLSQRVLGQYDLALLDPTVTPRLLLVAPNLALAARNLGLDRDELLAWVTIHEITHAVQFTGAPWLREYMGGLLRELIEGLQVNVSIGQLLKVPSSRDLRGLVERLSRGEILRITLGEERWAQLARMQAAMSVIEGHAEHVMDVVGAEVLPSLPRLRAAMNNRRENRGLPWRVLERLMGLELKLRQYEVGRRFCDTVVERGGPSALAKVWESPEALPNAAELEDAGLWLARVG
jgi:coenzyme F420 biosynthesis associated uncharacterized protein